MRRATLAFVLCVVPLAAGHAAAQEASWQRSCRFAVEVDGAAGRGTAVFESRGRPDLIGRLADGSWFLVRPPRQEVVPVASDLVELAASGDTLTLRGEPAAGGERLTLTPSGMTFDVGEHWVRVILTPPLLGEVSADDFLDLCPRYRASLDAYRPAQEPLRTLSGAGRDLSLEVYFGSWCPHCQEVLPRLIKCLQMAENPRLRVKYIGLPRLFANEPEVKARKVTAVPTVIVLNEGKELGRFSGGEDIPIEESLARLLGG